MGSKKPISIWNLVKGKNELKIVYRYSFVQILLTAYSDVTNTFLFLSWYLESALKKGKCIVFVRKKNQNLFCLLLWQVSIEILTGACRTPQTGTWVLHITCSGVMTKCSCRDAYLNYLAVAEMGYLPVFRIILQIGEMIWKNKNAVHKRKCESLFGGRSNPFHRERGVDDKARMWPKGYLGNYPEVQAKKRRPKLLQETKHVIGGSVASKTYGVIFPFSLVNVHLEAVNFKSYFY